MSLQNCLVLEVRSSVELTTDRQFHRHNSSGVVPHIPTQTFLIIYRSDQIVVSQNKIDSDKILLPISNKELQHATQQSLLQLDCSVQMRFRISFLKIGIIYFYFLFVIVVNYCTNLLLHKIAYFQNNYSSLHVSVTSLRMQLGVFH